MFRFTITKAGCFFSSSPYSVMNPASISILARCCGARTRSRLFLRGDTMNNSDALRAFYDQLGQFCRILQSEHLATLDEATGLPRSARIALAFSERLILCPTTDSARVCIRKDLGGALSFLLAAQGVHQRIEKGDCHFAQGSPQHQTSFYILAGAVQDYIDSLYTQVA